MSTRGTGTATNPPTPLAHDGLRTASRDYGGLGQRWGVALAFVAAGAHNDRRRAPRNLCSFVADVDRERVELAINLVRHIRHDGELTVRVRPGAAIDQLDGVLLATVPAAAVDRPVVRLPIRSVAPRKQRLRVHGGGKRSSQRSGNEDEEQIAPG